MLHDQLAPLRNYKPKRLRTPGLRASAVLAPIWRSEGGQLLFTLRAKGLRNHAGQISFPGGRVEKGEEPLAAALRESEEEIGLPPGQVEILGQLDDVLSPRGYHIQCFVGLVDNFEPKLNEDEVERLVMVDLDELFDTSLHRTELWKGVRRVHYFDFRDGLVWGVTGQMAYLLREVLSGRRV